jgi:cytosine/uracil/thiamine/allantoin permease
MACASTCHQGHRVAGNEAAKLENTLPTLGADIMHVWQTLVLDAGLLMTLYLAWRIALVYAPRAREALRVFAPWAGVATALYVIGVWIFLQPMEMRGMRNINRAIMKSIEYSRIL